MAELRLAEQRQSRFFSITEVIQRVLIGVLLLGTVLLWWGVLSSLLQTGGFAGIISWQTMGIGLAIFQSYTLTKVLAGRIPNRQQRQRLRAIRAILLVNIFANLIALGIIYAVNPIVGRFYLTMQDVANFAIFILVLGVILFNLRFQPHRLREPKALFWLAVTSRVIPQATLAFSTQLTLVPVAAILGVLLIGLQRIIVMGLEYRAALKKKQPGAGENLRWTLASDILNTIAAVWLLLSWQIVT